MCEKSEYEDYGSDIASKNARELREHFGCVGRPIGEGREGEGRGPSDSNDLGFCAFVRTVGV